MSDQIKLDDCPEILKAAVKAELARVVEYDPYAKIISCTAHKSLNGANATYAAYIFYTNAFVVLSYIDEPKYYDIGVIKDSVTIGDIKEIIKAAPEHSK